MKDKIRLILTLCVFSLIIGLFSIWQIFKPTDEISQWERRKLAQFPSFSVQALISGDFREDFESYLSDQFPLRDSFRRIKSIVHFNVFNQSDNGGIYVAQGSASKLDPVLNEESVKNATNKINSIYEQYLKDTSCRLFYSIVPDKNRYLAENNGYPAMDYEALEEIMRSELSYMTEIDISSYLEWDSYYFTDSHWRQEKLGEVADAIRNAMNNGEEPEYTEKNSGKFYGVYYGQSALPLDEEELNYLTNDGIEGCTVYNYETGKYTKVYDMEKRNGLDPYDIFLSGAASLLRIDNPEGEKGRELIVFRDSFGSSLVPLLISSYSKIILVDTRYIAPQLLGEYIDFDNQDVLFLYSTLLLNSSSTMK